MKNKRVIVPQLSGHTFEAAEEYGRIEPLLDDRIGPFNVDLIRKKIDKRFAELEIGEEDFLLLCGQVIVNALVMHEWLTRFGRVELLLFHARDENYVHRVIQE